MSDSFFNPWHNASITPVPASNYFGPATNDVAGKSAIIPNSVYGTSIQTDEGKSPGEHDVPGKQLPNPGVDGKLPGNNGEPGDKTAKPGLDPKTQAGIEAGVAILNEVGKAIAAQKAQPTTSEMGKEKRAKIGKKAKKKYDL